MDVDVLISSDLRRAVETALIARVDLDLEPVQDPRWREADIGTWQGLHRDEARQRWPEEWEMARREDVARGGGETFLQVQARVLAALGDLLAMHAGQTIAVITHGGPIYACLGAVLNHSFPEVYERLPANRNTSVTILRFEGGQIEPLASMDSSHLEALDGEQTIAGNGESPVPEAPTEI
jgi:broad specificity phosphatase PhoE